MDITSERIFCAEQINVPCELPAVLKDYTKAVIRNDPSSGEVDPMAARLKLFQWSRDYFRQRAQEAKS
uniref:Ropporin 1-like n=1 Tax=Karlodinium veneficum TaxID=407301 RepID=E8Z749_KARVE|nr:ropporin 1-like [Karlodinium veneficum]